MENQAAGSCCLALPLRQGCEPTATAWGEGADISQDHPGQETHPRFLPPHLPLSLPHSCGSKHLALGADWVHLALKTPASHGEASTTVFMEILSL